MKKAMLVVLVVLAFAGFDDGAELVVSRLTSSARTTITAAAARAVTLRTAAPSVPATAARADAGSYALWGQDASPLYGADGRIRRQRKIHRSSALQHLQREPGSWRHSTLPELP